MLDRTRMHFKQQGASARLPQGTEDAITEDALFYSLPVEFCHFKILEGLSFALSPQKSSSLHFWQLDQWCMHWLKSKSDGKGPFMRLVSISVTARRPGTFCWSGRERVIEINMKRELLQITNLIFYLWRQIPASCVVSSYGTCQCASVWWGPALTRLEIDAVSLHFSFWDKTWILKHLFFTAFPASHQFYNAFLNPDVLFGIPMPY